MRTDAELRRLAQNIVNSADPLQAMIQRKLRELDPWYVKLWRAIRRAAK